MVEVQGNNAPTCPRCDGRSVEIVAHSPVPGVWEMHLCQTCFYGWRSTEPPYATTPEALSPGFRIDAAKLGQGRRMPEIPPLRTGVVPKK